MIKFTAMKTDLKKALSIATLSIGNSMTNVHSHTLFEINDDVAVLYSTDEDRIAIAYLSLKDVDGDMPVRFTADPKKIQALINTADTDEIKFSYDPEIKTLNVYASENQNAYISFASFDPDSFLRFDKDLEETEEYHEISANLFFNGLQFIMGFLPNDDKNKKYSNLFIISDTMYGSNGITKIAAFKSEEMTGLPDLILRKPILQAIITMINKLGLINLSIKISNKYISFYSPDNLYSFGFKKSTAKVPKFPISTENPKTTGFRVNREEILKKLNRLALTSWEDIGVKISMKGTELLMETLTDRKSYETMSCERISGDQDLNFIVECTNFKGVLSQFEAPVTDIYSDKNQCSIFSKAHILYKDGSTDIKKPFIAIALMTLARIV